MPSKCDAKIILQWNYFEANHRKDGIDGVDGTVKHAKYSYVLTKRVVINH